MRNTSCQSNVGESPALTAAARELREATRVDERGEAEFIPVFLSGIPQLFVSRRIPLRCRDLATVAARPTRQLSVDTAKASLEVRGRWNCSAIVASMPMPSRTCGRVRATVVVSLCDGGWYGGAETKCT
jgi:hypothetical protein